MIIDQDEIEALLNQADTLREEAEEQLADAEAPAPAPEPEQHAAATKRALYSRATGEVKRILRVRVPVVVQLAERPMPVSTIRMLSAGAIMEFEKSVEDELEVFIRNRKIGRGAAVKVGEHFGVRISKVGTLAERIRSLG